MRDLPETVCSAVPLVEEPGVDHSKHDGAPEDVHVPASGLHGSGPAKDDASVTALLSYHLTAQMLWLASTRMSKLPVPFSFKLFSSSRLQLGKLTCLAVPT